MVDLKLVINSNSPLMKNNIRKLSILSLFLLLSYNLVNSQQKEILLIDSVGKVNLPYLETKVEQLTGAVSIITDEELSGRFDLNLLSSLKGLASGLYVSENPSANRKSDFDISIRGLNSTSIGNSAPLIIVDGIQRPIEYVQSNDVESITVLKDAVSKSFYRGKAVNGIISIKTKRGRANEDNRNIHVESGISYPQQLPILLNSYDYVNYYNLARRNSGLTDLYSNEDIEGYKNPNIRYPSNDYHKLLLNENLKYLRTFISFIGGTEKLKYFLGGGYIHNGGLEGIGNSNSLNQFNIRTNLDYSVTSHIDAFLDIYGFLDNNRSNFLRGNDLFRRMSIQRPNEYSILLKDHQNQDSIRYGAGRLSTLGDYQNLYAEMLRGGFRENTERIGQMNMGFNLNLNPIFNGLTAKIAFSFDTYNYTSTGKNDDFYSYMPTAWDNTLLLKDSLVTAGIKNSNMSTLGSDGYRQYSILGQLNYNRYFGDHHIATSLSFDGDNRDNMYLKYKSKTQSNTLLFQYIFQNKIVADLNLGLLGSSKIDKKNRYQLFPAAGIGWIMSNEDFMSNAHKINFLKLKASYGISGSDDALDFFSYQTRWSYYNNYTYFGSDAKNEVNTTKTVSFGFPTLNWETSKEFNIGFEMLFLDNFHVDINYYNINRSNIPVQGEKIFSQIWGINNLQMNYAQIQNNGFDFSIRYLKKISHWTLNANFNANYSISKYSKSMSWSGIPENRNLNNKAVDSYIGLMSDGIVSQMSELLDILPHSFGKLEIGDLKYKDLNLDQKIDQNDVKVIGNSFPRIHFGLNLIMSYKNLGFRVSGYGATAYDLYLNTIYHRPTPEIAYSVIVKDAFNPETGEGTYPRLSMGSATNNYQLSDFWLVDGTYFKIKDLELNYVLPLKVSDFIRSEQLKLFLRGNNLMTISAFKDLDPESIQAGLTRYPFFRSFSAGFSLKF